MIKVIKKYYLFLLLSCVFAYTNNETGWEYTQGTQQCFYMFESINIDNEVATGDGGPANDYFGECINNPNTCDVIGAFIGRNEIEFAADLNNDGEISSYAEVCVGWMYVDSSGWTTLPLIGADPSDDDFLGYINTDEIPFFKIYDHNNSSILPLEISNMYYEETFTDINENGQWDEGQEAEPFTDSNGNGQWDDDEIYDDDNENGEWDEGEYFYDGNGQWNEGEEFTDELNGFYDEGEEFEDTNDNDLWDDAEDFIDTDGNGQWDEGEDFEDANNNGLWDDAEDFTDALNGEYDEGESFIDVGNGIYDYAEPFEDLNGNESYDGFIEEEPFQDVNDNDVYNGIVEEELLGWSYNDIFLYNGSIDAYNIYGCNDSNACNYDDLATANDENCVFAPEGDIISLVTVDGNIIEFSWEDPQIGTPNFQYQVKLFDGNNVEVFNQNNSTSPIVFENLNWSTNYTIEVTTTNFDVCESLVSTFEATTSAMPDPGQVVVDAPIAGEGEVFLSWSSVDYASTYVIFSNNSIINEIESTIYVDTELAPGVTNLYQIQAVNLEGTPGLLSEPVSAQTLELSDALLDSVVVGQGQLEISWSMDNNQLSYADQSYVFDVYMDDEYLATRYGTFHVINNLDPEEEYCFHVIPKVELNVDGESLIFSSNQSNTMCGSPDQVSGWSILIESQLNAWESELVYDIYNELGMKPEASDGYDPDLDIPEPPVTGGLDYWISLSFPHPEWNLGIGGVPQEYFTTDLRELTTDLFKRVEAWDVNIISSAPGSGLLSFNFISDAGGYPVYLKWDNQYSRIHDDAVIDYVYNTPEVLDGFNIIVGNQNPEVPNSLEVEGISRDMFISWNETTECEGDEEECNEYSSRYPATSYKVYRSWYQEITPHVVGLVGTRHHSISILPIQLNAVSGDSFEIVSHPLHGYLDAEYFESFSDSNFDGDYNPEEDFLDCGWDGLCPEDDGYASEVYSDFNDNGQYDLGEDFIDSNFNDIWDENGPDLGEGDGICNKVFYYHANENFDEGIDSISYVNGSYDYGENYIDDNSDGNWDIGEEFFDAPRYLNIKITDQLESSYIDIGLNTGTSYTYTILASNNAGESDLSMLASDQTAPNIAPTADAGEDQIRYIISENDSIVNCQFPYDYVYDDQGNELIDDQGLPILDNVNNSFDEDGLEGEFLSYYWEIYDPDSTLNLQQPSIISNDTDDDAIDWWQFGDSEISSIDLPETAELENGHYLVRLYVEDMSEYVSIADYATIQVTRDVPVPAQVENLEGDGDLYYIRLSWDESAYDAPGEGPNIPPNDYDGILELADDYHIYRDSVLHAVVSSDSLFYIDNELTPQEYFFDLNGNSIWDQGETYIDENGNGSWDSVESHCYYIKAVNITGSALPSDEHCYSTGELPIPIILSPSGGEILTSGEFTAIEWNVVESNIQFIDSVSVYHSSDTGVNWTLEGSWASSDIPVFFDFEVPVTDTISFYNKFKVEVLDVGDYGGLNKKIHIDITDHLIIIANDSLQNSYSAGWNLVSSPLQLESTNVWENFMGDDDEILNFLLYSQNEEVCGFPQCDDQLFDFQVGEGFYMISQHSSTLGLHGDILDSYLISLNPGWNLIGNPLVAKVVVDSLNIIVNEDLLSWTAAIDSGFVLPSIQGFNNDQKLHIPVDVLEPFSGYWVHASDSIDLKIEPHIYDENLYTEQRNNSFELTFYAQEHNPNSAMLDLLWNDMIKIGLSLDGNDGMTYGEDQYDIPVIVNPASFTNIFIDHPEWEAAEIAENNRFFSDFRTLEGADIAKTWNITGQLLGNVISDSVSLYWDINNLNQLDDHEIFLVVGENIVDMRTEDSFVIAKEIFGNMQITVGPFVDAGSCEAQGLVECPDGSCALSIEDCVELSNESIPEEFSLSMPYPNPFNPSVKLDFSLPTTQIVEVNVYNLNGAHVENIVNGLQNVGRHSISWNANSYPTGIYFMRFVSEETTKTMKVMLIK